MQTLGVLLWNAGVCENRVDSVKKSYRFLRPSGSLAGPDWCNSPAAF